MSIEIERPKFYDFVNVYDFTCTLPGSKQELLFKPVSTGQLKRFLTYENETNPIIQERALDELISSSVLTEGFDIGEIYLDDRMYLLVELRKKTKGEVIEWKLNCPSCRSQSLQQINLDALEVNEIDLTNDNKVEIVNNIEVFLKHIKRKDQMEIRPNVFKKNMTARQQQAELTLYYNACAIDKVKSPNGVDESLTINDKKYLLENIPTGDYDKIRNKIEEMSFGVNMEYGFKCPHCKYEQKTEVPLEQNFFS